MDRLINRQIDRYRQIYRQMDIDRQRYRDRWIYYNIYIHLQIDRQYSSQAAISMRRVYSIHHTKPVFT